MNDLADLEHVQFGILSSSEIIKQSVCEVNISKLSSSNSVYDERMGTMDNNKLCATCGLNNKECVGHFGHIRLNIDILHPLFNKLVLSILKCICYKCSKILLTKEQLELNGLLKYQKQARFNKIIVKMDRVDFCSFCETVQPRYVFNTTDRQIYMNFKIEGENSRIQMLESEIKKIFENISDDDITILGFNAEHFHPKSLIISVLPVIPPVARPFIMTENITCDDDLTLQYTEIIKINQHLLDKSLSEAKLQKYTQSLKFKIKSLFDNSGDKQKLSNGRPLKGIKKRLTGKEGLIRNNLMGKRVDKSARTVIGPDPTLDVDQIAIPKEIADILCYPVRVNKYNIEYLKELIEKGCVNFLLKENGNVRINMRYASIKQGTKLHFGDILLKKNNTFKMIKYERDLFCLEEGDLVYRNGELLRDIVPNMRKPVNIQIGDVVERKLRDGDILLLNRQPTLHKGSMIAQKVVIRPGKTIRMNLAITKSFNADFDGDEMNLHCPASPETEAELRILSSIPQNIISCQSSKANIVIVQDALLGSYMMTISDRPLLSKELFCQISMAIVGPINFDKKIKRYHEYYNREIYTGRLLFSLLLPDDFQFEGKNDADKKEPKVIIRNGLLLEGAINKSNLSGSHSSFITLFYHEYGEQFCMKFINNVQFLAIKYILHHGFSIGMGDCIITKKDEINHVISKSFIKAKSMEIQTQEEQLKEIYISHALAGARDAGMAIAQKAMKDDNNFLKSVTSGSKGDAFNIAQITGCLGQQNLNGQRIFPALSDNRRTLPHYPIDPREYTDDMRYESQGFIKSCFTKGLNPREWYFHAMTGREGITDTAMKTATSGYIQRRMIKLAEDVQIKYDGTVRNSGNHIIQFAYGDNNLNPLNTVFEKGKAVSLNIKRLADQLNSSCDG